MHLKKEFYESTTTRKNLASQLMRSWIQAYPNAKGYRAYICRSQSTEGFAIPASKLCGDDGKPDTDTIRDLAATISQMMKPEPAHKLIEILEWPAGTKL